MATVGDGLAAVREALALEPDVLFFDIRMPGLSGLDAAVELADAWPADQPFPAWCLSRPTTSTQCRRSRRRLWTTCSNPCKVFACKNSAKLQKTLSIKRQQLSL